MNVADSVLSAFGKDKWLATQAKNQMAKDDLNENDDKLSDENLQEIEHKYDEILRRAADKKDDL